jgi:enoyl-[acyl-carrier-protein] reductase (NADH)
MHGALAMNIQSATRFKGHVEEAIKELSSALHVAREVSTHEEFSAIRKSIGNIIAAADTVLHVSVYSDHPELNEHHRGPNKP